MDFGIQRSGSRAAGEDGTRSSRGRWSQMREGRSSCVSGRLAYWVRAKRTELFADLEALGEPADDAQIALARTLFAKVLDAPGGGLRIQTIHSFCQTLLSAFPVEAGLTPGFRPLEAREESALAMLTSSLLSLLAQHPPDAATFYVLDGSPPDSPLAGHLERLTADLPHDVRHIAYREVPEAVAGIAAELERRVQSGEAEVAPIFIIVYGLQRYRQLRQEDDFGFSPDGDGAPRADKQFGEMLRDGPAHGVHTLAWCDTVNNVNRSLNRQGLREFENRVLFQMGASDSSTLIDTPLASKLGLHRALFYSEEQGTVEKFRPYAMPDDVWLANAVRSMRAKDEASAQT